MTHNFSLLSNKSFVSKKQITKQEKKLSLTKETFILDVTKMKFSNDILTRGEFSGGAGHGGCAPHVGTYHVGMSLKPPPEKKYSKTECALCVSIIIGLIT